MGLTWLTVCGCPRSGTTALGAALNTHPDIALFHEYDQAHFFRTIDAIFDEERRLQAWPDTAKFDMLPRKSRHATAFVKTIFREVSGKDTKIVGTKFPGAHLWPRPAIPEGMDWKQIHISREPFSVIASYARKMLKEGYPGGHVRIMETAVAHWLSAWNHAVDSESSDDFLHVMYDQICADPGDQARRISLFLGIETAPDFSSFRPSYKSPDECLAQLEADGFGEWINLMRIFDVCRDWQDFVRRRQKLGFPLASGGEIDLTLSGNIWKYPHTGFSPPQANGSLICGDRASIVFEPDFDADDFLLIVSYSGVAANVPQTLTLQIDGLECGVVRLHQGERTRNAVVRVRQEPYGSAAPRLRKLTPSTISLSVQTTGVGPVISGVGVVRL